MGSSFKKIIENCNFDAGKLVMQGYKFCMGAILTKVANDGKLVLHGYKILYGGDLDEYGNFKDGKLVMHGLKILYGAIWTKMAILTTGN